MEGSQMQLAGWCAVQHEWCSCHCQHCNRFLTACNRAGFAACVLARSGRSGSLGQAMRDFCVRGDARALVKQLDKGRQPQHAVASVLARSGWAAAAAATAEVDRSYLILAVNILQVLCTVASSFCSSPFFSRRAFCSTASLLTAWPWALKSRPFQSFISLRRIVSHVTRVCRFCLMISFASPTVPSAPHLSARCSTPLMTCCYLW
jgi:hypothetical protein